ncbi:DNA-directed RNA polymerase subunit L [Candidatus Bathyarchaeota archaeon]|nr:DNA-directed RNA polymerase subunit L [Candidatus Bathyarchaeota archaeon]
MKINVVKEEENYIEAEFGGEGHTLLNLVQSSLLEDPNVEMAGYTKTHPLMDKSILFIKMRNGKNPYDALKKATENAEQKLSEFITEFQKSS